MKHYRSRTDIENQSRILCETVIFLVKCIGTGKVYYRPQVILQDTAYNLSEIITEINGTEMLLDESKDESDVTTDNYISLPPYVYSGNDGIEKAIICIHLGYDIRRFYYE